MKRIFLTGVFFLASHGLWAQTQDIQIVPSSAEPAGAKHFCWRVRSATATVYLLGSIHVRPKVPLPLPEVVEKGFEASNYVGFEFDMGQLDKFKPEIEAYVREHFIYPPGDNLKNHMTGDEWEQVQKIIQKEQFPEQAALRFKPVFLSMTLSDLDEKKHGQEDSSGIDEIFLRKAQAAGKPTFGMEFWQEPLAAFDVLTDHEQVQFLIGSVQDSSNEWDNLGKIDDYWKAGDDVGMDRLINSVMEPEERPLMDRLLKDRNAKWMRQLQRMLRARATYFVVVGSAHLVGRFGLPNWARFLGYSVEQL